MRKGEPKTLRDAHEVVMDRRPPNDANPSVWLAFRLGNARLYKAIADVDRGHHHEALSHVDARKVNSISEKARYDVR
ncbi:AMED_5909 family protein [Amycolatopsis mediterranei]|uniref:AMED_5909 family protein n=1 Tax=Amycolatopsis mediterranei TaxID=33910 RepID=UPI000B2E2BBD|nr:AMED_5909 family protein [Amycolatopsis mediterranei]UZF74624.1 hypothetical protein ISP_008151 [Amycolatopsis mediterranei]